MKTISMYCIKLPVFRWFITHQKLGNRAVPEGPVAKTPCSQRRQRGFDSWPGTGIHMPQLNNPPGCNKQWKPQPQQPNKHTFLKATQRHRFTSFLQPSHKAACYHHLFFVGGKLELREVTSPKITHLVNDSTFYRIGFLDPKANYLPEIVI